MSEAERRSAEWDLQSGPRNYLAMVSGQAVGTAAALATAWLATRSLGPGGYGALAAILAASQIVNQLTVQWTAASLSRYGCAEFVATGRVAAAFWTRLVVLVPNLVLAVGTSVWWLPPILRWLAIPPSAQWLVVTHGVAVVAWIHVQQTLQAAKLPRAQAVLLALERLQVAALLLVLVVTRTASVVTVTLAFIAAAALASLLGLWRLRALVYPAGRVDPSLLRAMVAFSLPLLPHSIIGYLSTNYLDAFFIMYFLSARDLGIYWLAYQLAGALMQMPQLAGSLLLPFFITLDVQGRERHTERFLREVLPLLGLAWSLASAMAAVAGTFLVPRVFGAPYAGAADLLWPFMAAAALAGPTLMGFGPAALARAATSVPAIGAAVAALVNLVLNALLIPPFGLVGCAWATTGAHAAFLVTVEALLSRQIPSSRTWVIASTSPAVAGAVYAGWRGDDLGGLGVAILVAAALVGWHHRRIAVGVSTLRETGVRVLRPVDG